MALMTGIWAVALNVDALLMVSSNRQLLGRLDDAALKGEVEVVPGVGIVVGDLVLRGAPRTR